MCSNHFQGNGRPCFFKERRKAVIQLKWTNRPGTACKGEGVNAGVGARRGAGVGGRTQVRLNALERLYEDRRSAVGAGRSPNALPFSF